MPAKHTDWLSLAALSPDIFMVFGGAYFLWRWNYFGYPLPNPYYVKGGGVFHFDSLLKSMERSWKLILPVSPIFILALFSASARRLALAFSIPIIGAIGMWVLMSDDMNFRSRFQYPVLGIALLSWYPLFVKLREDHRWLSILSSANIKHKKILVSVVAVCGTQFSPRPIH